MRLFSKLLTLSGEERRLLAESIGVLSMVRVSLLLFQTKRTIRWASDLGEGVRQNSRRSDAEMMLGVAVAVRRAARLVPGTTCLTQAIAAKILLKRRGQPSSIRIGVARPIAGSLRAHAWLEVDDVTFIGHFQPNAYVPFSDSEAFN